MIELPKKTNDSDAGNDDVKDDANKSAAASIEGVMSKVGGLAEELGQMNKDRRDKEAAKKVSDEEDEETKLAAEADLKALMEGSDETNIPADIKTRKQQVDDMSNSEVMDVITNAIETALTARFEQSGKDIDKKFKTTADAMGKIIGLLGKMQAATAFERIRGKYPDFDDFAEDTGKVIDKYPMMDIEDAHLLARKIREGNSPPASQTDFERPDGMLLDRGEGRETSTKVKEEGTPKSDITHGVVAFRDFLNKALDKRNG